MVPTWKRSSRRRKAHLKSKEEKIKAWNQSEKVKQFKQVMFPMPQMSAMNFCEVLLIMFLGSLAQTKQYQLRLWDEIVKPAKTPFLSVKRLTCALLVTATRFFPQMHRSFNCSHQWHQRIGSERNAIVQQMCETNEQDNFIRSRALASVSKDPATLDVGDKLKNTEKGLTDLVNQQVCETMKIACENLGKSYALVVAVGKPTETCNTNASQKNNKAKTVYNSSQHLRINGLPGDPIKRRGEIFAPQMPKWTKSWTQRHSRRASLSSEDLEDYRWTDNTANAAGNNAKATGSTPDVGKKSWISGRVETERSVYIACSVKRRCSERKSNTEEEERIPGSRRTCTEAENRQLGIVQRRTESRNEDGGNQFRLTR